MTTNQSLIRQPNPTIGQYTTNPHRRTFLGGALGALLASQGRVLAEDTDAPNNPFILLLHGVYQPVAHGPNLGLKSVNLRMVRTRRRKSTQSLESMEARI